MGDTRENNTVAGSENSLYAAQGGYAGRTVDDVDKKTEDGKARPGSKASASSPDLSQETRQEAQATIRSNELEGEEK